MRSKVRSWGKKQCGFLENEFKFRKKKREGRSTIQMSFSKAGVDTIKAFIKGNGQLVTQVRTRYRVLDRLEGLYPSPGASKLHLWSTDPLSLEEPGERCEAALLRRAAEEGRVSYAELEAVATAVGNSKRYLPFFVGFMVPLLGYLVPLLTAAKPELLPPMFWRESVRIAQSGEILRRAAEGAAEWSDFISRHPPSATSALLKELIRKANDGQLTPSDLATMDSKLPSSFAGFSPDHRFLLLSALPLTPPHTPSGPPSTSVLAAYSFRVALSDALLRAAPENPHGIDPSKIQSQSSSFGQLLALDALQLSDATMLRNIPGIVPVSDADGQFCCSLESARGNVSQWLQLGLTHYPSYPHAAVLNRINSDVRNQ